MIDPTLIAAGIAAVGAVANTAVTLVYGSSSNRKLEEVKSQFNLRLHIHKAQFEKEFQVIEEIWTALVKLRNACERLRPGPKSAAHDPEKDRENFGKSYWDFLRLIDTRQPFFPQEIFDLLENYRQRQFKFFLHHRRITDPEFKRQWVAEDYWDKADENLNEIDHLFEEVLKAIRKRTEASERVKTV